MAKLVRWTNQAKADRIGILDYFRKRNGSTHYSKKLNRAFIKEVKFIADFPNIGKPTNSENIRVKVSGDYYLIYQIDAGILYILRIWDIRQNPINLSKHHNPND